MRMIVAALEEELEAGLELCVNRRKIHIPGISLWQAERGRKTICFLKTGVGPKRSAESLDEALKAIRPSHILVIGYAGALDAELKLGDLVAVRKAMAVNLDEKRSGWEHARLDDAFDLADGEALARSAKSIGLDARVGDALTSPYVLGEPAHKKLLRDKFHASIVDMETAALARVSLSRRIPLSCVRAVSDEVQDTFLAPFSHDPSAGIPARAKKLIGAGMMHTLRDWKDHAAVARTSLARFLAIYP